MNFLQRHRERLFPGVPILVSALDRRRLRDVSLGANATAVSVLLMEKMQVESLAELVRLTREGGHSEGKSVNCYRSTVAVTSVNHCPSDHCPPRPRIGADSNVMRDGRVKIQAGNQIGEVVIDRY
jgi:hypothetical protein